MILTADEIRNGVEAGQIKIEDFTEDRLNPNSYNLRLSDTLLQYDEIVLDPKKENKTRSMNIPSNGFILQPNQLYLCSTKEYTETHGCVPMLEGRSSLARLGLSVHVTAGFGDIGFCGRWTLEMSCIHPVLIYPDMEICQIYYVEVSGEVTFEYNGRYQGAKEVAPCKYYLTEPSIDRPDTPQ